MAELMLSSKQPYSIMHRELTLALIRPHAGRKCREEMASHPKISHYLHKSLHLTRRPGWRPDVCDAAANMKFG